MKRKLPDVITEQEYKKIKSFVMKPKHRLAFDLGFGCGLRVSEVISLQKEDVDLQRKLLHIRQAKGEKDRFVPIPKNFNVNWGLLPIGTTRQNLNQVLRRVVGKSKITKRITFHTLRHSYASILLNKGWDIRQIQQLLGHSDIKITQIYTHISKEDLVKKMEETFWG